MVDMNESLGVEGSVEIVNSGESDGSDVDDKSVSSGGYNDQSLLVLSSLQSLSHLYSARE